MMKPVWLAVVVLMVQPIPSSAFRGSRDALGSSAANAAAIARAIRMFASDHQGALPPMASQPAFRAAIAPYIPYGMVYTSFLNVARFRPNAALDGLNEGEINEDPYLVPVVSDLPVGDARAVVGFLDGHVEHNGTDVRPPRDIQIERLKALHMAALTYADDWRGTLPPLAEQPALEEALYPYLRSYRVFVDPISGQPFRANVTLSSRPLSGVGGDWEVIPLFSTTDPADPDAAVVYLDGHVVVAGVDADGGEIVCRQRLRRLVIAVKMYADDNGYLLPPLADTARLKEALFYLLHSDGHVYECPVTHLPYSFNRALSGQPEGSFEDPFNTLVVHDAAAHLGKVNGAYLDGSVRSLPAP